MSALNKLINQKVIATLNDGEEDYTVEGTVLDVEVNDYYFYEKGEPIYITVSIMPTSDLPEDFDPDEYANIPLENIRKA